MHEEQEDTWNDIEAKLQEGERVVAVAFGHWMGSDYWERTGGSTLVPRPAIPKEKRGVVLPPEEARQFMIGWNIDGYGEAYAMTVWTTRRVLFTCQYESCVALGSVPRDPADHMPDMPGGG